jgi:hypothetical protein
LSGPSGARHGFALFLGITKNEITGEVDYPKTHQQRRHIFEYNYRIWDFPLQGRC